MLHAVQQALESAQEAVWRLLWQFSRHCAVRQVHRHTLAACPCCSAWCDPAFQVVLQL